MLYSGCVLFALLRAENQVRTPTSFDTAISRSDGITSRPSALSTRSHVFQCHLTTPYNVLGILVTIYIHSVEGHKPTQAQAQAQADLRACAQPFQTPLRGQANRETLCLDIVYVGFS